MYLAFMAELALVNVDKPCANLQRKPTFNQNCLNPQRKHVLV